MAVVGVVLAGGAGRRMGGEKALAQLDGLALLHHPLRALAAVTAAQAVVAKAGTRLPALPPDVAVWTEPDEPLHPLTGIVEALRRARGPVLCCAVDLPLLDAVSLVALLDAPGSHGCVVPRAAGRLQPLCALWRPAALPVLERLAPDVRMAEAVAAAGALEVALADARPFTNVNTPEELAALSRR